MFVFVIYVLSLTLVRALSAPNNNGTIAGETPVLDDWPECVKNAFFSHPNGSDGVQKKSCNMAPSYRLVISFFQNKYTTQHCVERHKKYQQLRKEVLQPKFYAAYPELNDLKKRCADPEEASPECFQHNAKFHDFSNAHKNNLTIAEKFKLLADWVQTKEWKEAAEVDKRLEKFNERIENMTDFNSTKFGACIHNVRHYSEWVIQNPESTIHRSKLGIRVKYFFEDEKIGGLKATYCADILYDVLQSFPLHTKEDKDVICKYPVQPLPTTIRY